MQRDDRADWRQQQDQDREIAGYMEAVETVAHFVGGDEGERLKRALFEMAHLPMPTPDRQLRLPDMGAEIPW